MKASGAVCQCCLLAGKGQGVRCSTLLLHPVLCPCCQLSEPSVAPALIGRAAFMSSTLDPPGWCKAACQRGLKSDTWTHGQDDESRKRKEKQVRKKCLGARASERHRMGGAGLLREKQWQMSAEVGKAVTCQNSGLCFALYAFVA